MIAKWGLALLLFCPVGTTLAQQQADTPQQGDSLAAVARRMREQRKDQPKSAKVWSNDNLPKSPDELSVVGNDSPAPGNSANPATGAAATPEGANAAGAAKKPADEAAKKAQVAADIASAKDQLQTLQNESDILQRKLTLDKQTYYGKPDYASDQAGADGLKGEQDQVDAKQDEIAAVQKKISDLQSQASPAGDSGNTGSTDNPGNTPQ